MDIAGRIFLLATLGVGIALMGDDNGDSGGQVVCDVILAVIVLASNALFVFVLNPRKLLRGVVKAAREMRAAARAAGWNEDAIKKMSSKEFAEITASDVKGCSPLQVWWLLQYHRESDTLRDDLFSLEARAAAHAAGWNEDVIKKMSSKELAEVTADDVKGCSSLQVWWLLQYHLESDSSLPADVFSSVTELNLKDAKLSGKSHTFLPLSDRHNRRICVNLVAFGCCAWSSIGVPLHEVLRRLAKGGASNLEVLARSGHKLGGTLTSDIAIFTKLKKLNLDGMGLGGEIFRTQHTCVVCLLTFSLVLQENCPRSSATSSI